MTHLTVEEIIDFVSFDKLTEENIALAKKVNEHICSCKSCFEKVSAFQLIFEEFEKIGRVCDAKESIYQILDQGLLHQMQEDDVKKAIASLEHDGEEVVK